MRVMTVQERRNAVVARHHLAGDAAGPDEVTRALVALHATDPASVYLSVLARSWTSTVGDVANSLYGARSLVRWLAMRRTLFVFARDEIQVVDAAVTTTVARSLHTQLVNRLNRVGTDPPINQDVESWLDDVSHAVLRALRRRGAATGVQLAADEPRLQTKMKPRSSAQPAENLTTSLLTVLSAAGRIVRGDPTGQWTSRQHLWEPVERRWPDGLPAVNGDDARRQLARRWLERFGPATVDDLQWWTGWTKSMTGQTLAGMRFDEIDLHGRPGIALPETEPERVSPTAALLPALDPTPMGWKHRDWFFDIDPHQVFDSAGNVGPTVWWNGGIIGSWAVTPDGQIRTALIADHGADAATATRTAAESLQERLQGTVITPAVRTPLERSIVNGSI